MGPFRELVWAFYHEHGRDLPWRHDPTPYQVVVSEVMLQQTQVSRVLERYPRWLARFGGFEALAAASVAEVLEEWQGMGYNRRALWLQQLAQTVVRDFGGELPRDPALLMTLPGIGPNTAGSVAAFTYDAPVVFIETNIRRVFIYHYEELISSSAVSDFSRQRTLSVSSVEPISEPALTSSKSSPGFALPVSPPEVISDVQLRPLIEAALDREHPREWYYALMDYGADLAKRVPNPNRRSKHYAVQSKFEGSMRQLRGAVLRQLVAGPKTAEELAALINDERVVEVLIALVKEGFLREIDGGFHIA